MGPIEPSRKQPGVLWFDAHTLRVLNTLLLFGLALALVYLAWRTLIMFLFAILFAYLLEPIVSTLQHRLKVSRGWAVAMLYIVIVVVVGGFFVWTGPSILKQATRLAELAPSFNQRLQSGQIAQVVGTQRGWSYETRYRIQQFLVENRQQIAQWIQSFATDLENLAADAWWVVLIPLFAIFFLLAGDRFTNVLVKQSSRRRERVFMAALFQDIHDVLASYIRAQIALTALGTTVYLIAFSLLRMPYAIALGVTAGLLEFIPVVGPIAGTIIVLVTLFIANYHLIWAVLVFLGVWRVIQDYLNTPHIMGGQVQLPSLAVLFGVFAGAEVAGIIGVYLSIPIMATLRVIWVRWREFPSGSHDTGPGMDIPPQGGSAPNG